MDARNNGDKNPFDNTLYCLEWIATAMEAARRHNEQRSVEGQPAATAIFPSRPRALPDPAE
jgi:hypothetical protein